MSELIFRGGTILCMDENFSIEEGDLACKNNEIVQVGGAYTPTESDYSIIDCAGSIVMPGFVQSHVHMCQTLARGRADNLELLDWLHQVVWPYEGSLNESSLLASARLACTELLLGGTTAIMDMGTVHHTDMLFQAAQETGLRATIGKAMMDAPDPDIPPGLRETTKASLDESVRLCRDWHGRCDDRLRYGYAPRFALSCTQELLEESARLARSAGARLHTHTSENRAEISEVKRRTGKENIEYLHSVGLTGSDVGLAHCVWLSDNETTLLQETGTHVLHCPSSNLKLASGIAKIPDLLAKGISVSFGADGAPCNNTLDAFRELRAAALIHKPSFGPKAMPAATLCRIATLGGANALGIADQVGSLEVGKRADVIAVAIDTPHSTPSHDPYSTLAYSARADDVRHVAVDGTLLVRDRSMLSVDTAQVLREANAAAHALFPLARSK